MRLLPRRAKKGAFWPDRFQQRCSWRPRRPAGAASRRPTTRRTGTGWYHMKGENTRKSVWHPACDRRRVSRAVRRLAYRWPSGGRRRTAGRFCSSRSSGRRWSLCSKPCRGRRARSPFPRRGRAARPASARCPRASGGTLGRVGRGRGRREPRDGRQTFSRAGRQPHVPRRDRTYRRPPGRRHQWPTPAARVVAPTNNILNRVPFSLGNSTDSTLTPHSRNKRFQALARLRLQETRRRKLAEPAALPRTRKSALRG